MTNAAPSEPGRSVHPVIFIILTIGMTSVTYGFGRYAFGLFLPALHDDFAAATWQLGAIASANAVVYLVSTAVASACAIYFRPAVMMTVACLITVVGLVTAGVSTSFAGAALGIILAGIGAGVVSPALFEAIESSLSGAWKVRAIGAVSAGATPGMIVTAMAAYAAADAWRIAWLIMAGVGLLIIILSVFTFTHGHATRIRKSVKLALSLSLFFDGRHARLYFVLLVYGILFSVYLTFAVGLLSQFGNLAPPQDRLFWALLGAAGLPAVLNGVFISSFGLANFLRLTFGACALAYALIALMPNLFGAVLLSAVLFGYSSISIGSGLLVWGVGKFKGRPSIGSGVVLFLFSSTTIIGPILSSAVLPHIGSTFLFVALAILSMLMLPLAGSREIAT